jgi:hypothetical protein
LLVADPLLTATIDNDAPETRPGQTSDDTLTASEPHRAHGHGLDLPRLHAEKSMLKQEIVTEMMPAQPRADAAHASGQAQEQVHAPTRASAEPIADSAHVVAESLLHRNLLIDMGYGPDEEVGLPSDGNSNVDSNEESDDEHDGSSVARRGLEGEDDGVTGCEGVDGAEEGASMAAREAEGSDGDDVMAGKENISMQRAEGSGGVTAGIKKKKPKRRAKGTKSQKQRQDAARPGLVREA